MFLDKFLKFKNKFGISLSKNMFKKKRNDNENEVDTTIENKSSINSSDDDILSNIVDHSNNININTIEPTIKPLEENPDDISEDKLEELNNMFEKLDNDEDVLKNINTKLSDSTTSEEFEEDISAILENSSENIEIDESPNNNLNFINNVSVYDNQQSSESDINEEILDSSKKSKKQKKSKQKNKKSGAVIESSSVTYEGVESKPKINIFYIAIGSLVVIIIGVSFLMMYLTKGMKKKLASDSTTISKENYSASSNNNLIYVNNSKEFNGEFLEVKKILLDELDTTIYFNLPIDLNSTNINIADNNDKMYFLDFTSYSENHVDNKTLTLQPLDNGITNFKIVVTDTNTKELLEFKFDLEKPLVKLPSLYTNENYEVQIPQSDSTLTIENSVFSSSKSIINYKIENRNPKKNLKIANENNLSTITLKEGASKVLPFDGLSKQNYFENEKTVLGNVQFFPLKNLSSKTTVTFEKVYNEIDISEEIEPSKLFLDRIDTEHTIQIDNYNVILERMGSRKDKIILVAHAEDTSIFDNTGKAEENLLNRKEIQLDVELIVPIKVLDEEKTVKIKGTSKSSQNGSDIIFDTTGISGIQPVEENNYKLIINSVMVVEPPISVEIDLTKASNTRPQKIIGINNFILKSFENNSFIDDKSKDFSKIMIANEQVMDDYTKIESFASTNHFAKVISTSFSGDKILSVVQEIFIEDNNKIKLNKQHKIILEYKK